MRNAERKIEIQVLMALCRLIHSKVLHQQVYKEFQSNKTITT